ncbi:MAG: pilus assembly protein TadG-related protein [Bellilinea sp.]
MKSKKTNESGQILVFLALVLMGLLGFTALAIDGGMIYADRRYTQSAADAASLAGAGAIGEHLNDIATRNTIACTTQINSIGISNAVNQAGINGYSGLAEGDATTDHGVFITCVPGSTGYIDVVVRLSKVTSTSFVQLFTGNPMRNSVASTTRVYPATEAGGGHAIVSLSVGCGNNVGGVHLGGTTNVDVTGGGIFSNSCTDAHGDFDVLVKQAEINYHCSVSPEPWCPFVPDGGGTISPEPSPESTYLDITAMNVASLIDCWEDDSYDNFKLLPSQTATLSPGNYGSWDIKGTLKLQPGLYCISGSVSMTGGTVEGSDVTIYYTGDAFTLNGGVGTSLSAPNEAGAGQTPPPAREDRAVEDLLLYVPPGDTVPVININGTSDSGLVGTILAPTSLITINGNATAGKESKFYTSIIGFDVNLTGASNINILYDPDVEFGRPSFLSVQK